MAGLSSEGRETFVQNVEKLPALHRAVTKLKSGLRELSDAVDELKDQGRREALARGERPSDAVDREVFVLFSNQL